MNIKRAVPGFTLLEILLALSILSISALLLIRADANNGRRQNLLLERQVASDLLASLSEEAQALWPVPLAHGEWHDYGWTVQTVDVSLPHLDATAPIVAATRMTIAVTGPSGDLLGSQALFLPVTED